MIVAGLTVDLLNDIEPDWRGEDSGERQRARRLASWGPDGDGGSGSHFSVKGDYYVGNGRKASGVNGTENTGGKKNEI